MTALPSAPSRITEDQRKWLQAGLTQPGGKLPNFDALGARVADNVIDTCLQNGWAEQWMYNPLKPDWKVCRLTDAGRAAMNKDQIIRVDFSRWQRDDSVSFEEPLGAMKATAI